MGSTVGPHFGGGSGAQLHRHVMLERVEELDPAPRRPGLRRIGSVTQAAMDAGHIPDIKHVGKRFKIVCACGFTTPSGMTRKNAFQAISDHLVLAGRTALGEEPKMGKIPPVKPAVDPRVSEPSVGPSL